MRDESANMTEFGFKTRFNWLIGGAIGGIVGSILFGLVLWITNPDIITEVIPTIYSVDSGSTGWIFHVLHGLVLGVVFGYLVSRDAVIGSLTADVETGFISSMGMTIRLSLAGLVFGIAVWTALPLIANVGWTITGVTDPAFPLFAGETLIGHMIYGVLLGFLFSLIVDISPASERTDAPFDEADDATD